MLDRIIIRRVSVRDMDIFNSFDAFGVYWSLSLTFHLEMSYNVNSKTGKSGKLSASLIEYAYLHQVCQTGSNV